MKILYQIPSLNTQSAGRTIYHGYKNAFEDMGHIFSPLTSENNPEEVLREFKPDILITSLNSYCIRYLSPQTIAKYKKKGMKVFVNIAFWKSPMSKLRINETPSISDNKDYVSLIQSGTYGDIYYNICEQGDTRMDGFKKTTGYTYHTVLLAADKTLLYPEFADNFKADISFIGTYLPDKRDFFQKYVFPLHSDYDLRLYGQDWTNWDRILGTFHKGGQYFNIPLLKTLRKPTLKLEDERKIYSSSTISINVHEEYQRTYGGDCNERTFKIPLAGGFEITDDVSCIRKYFIDGKELIIAKDEADWFEKIAYYIRNPEKREPIIEAGKKRVLKDHTYHNRAQQLIEIYSTIK